MGKVLTIEQTSRVVKKLKNLGQRIVLVGGCFDILHQGHIKFLKKARAAGDILIIALESDEKVRQLKGEARPINSQHVRANILSNLPMVDYCIALPYLEKDLDYKVLVKTIGPDIIAVAKPDKLLSLKKKYADMVGGKVVEVMIRATNYSTTSIVQNLKL